MAFLDKLGDLAKNIGDKTSDAIETTKLGGKISAEKTAIAECCRQIGDFLYQKHRAGEETDPGVAELLAAIDGHNQAIAEAQAEIERIKAENAAPAPSPASGAGGLTCAACGGANAAGTKFCCACGAKLEAAAANFCPDCGAQNPPGTKFCCACGHKFM